eukprot:GILI01004191.1.p1 GENE.GILI01004191.1~~GILI01004191.1.p1  ORF type:complete len:229 (-),score=81.90 GILI01004191.1:408-1094(-)
MPLVVITGANRGIGLELCKKYVARGDTVIAACRSASAELRQLAVSRVIEGVDVASDASVAKFAEEVASLGQNVDILLNNAGILSVETIDELNFEAMVRQFEVNSLGPLRVTAAFRKKNLLKAGSKVAIITSRMGSIADNGTGSYYGYRMSKAAVNMAGSCMAKDLSKEGIAVILLHPGMVATDMTLDFGHHNCISTDESAVGLVERIDELSLDTSGCFMHKSGESLPW